MDFGWDFVESEVGLEAVRPWNAPLYCGTNVKVGPSISLKRSSNPAEKTFPSLPEERDVTRLKWPSPPTLVASPEAENKRTLPLAVPVKKVPDPVGRAAVTAF